jgi:hypothetical protein
MNPAPAPISRFTLPLHSGHFVSGASFMDWNSSKRCPHFWHSYS